jgi:hypothetical protein
MDEHKNKLECFDREGLPPIFPDHYFLPGLIPNLPFKGTEILKSAIIDNLLTKVTPQEIFRGDIMQITLRINGSEYEEAFNRYLDIDLNLILYVIKFLKRKPETAAKEVLHKRYCLYDSTKK